jgi:hypothetical protein
LTHFNKRKDTSPKPGVRRRKIKDEEKTHAMTPDKMDRTGKVKGENEKTPYPLTEEEATPTTPESEKKSN